MADCGVASRRKCEEIILQGKVKVNGIKVTELGTKVTEEDEVSVNGEVIKKVFKKVYIAMNKPVGYITSVSDEFDRPTVMNLVEDEIHTRVYPVGRLDFDTEGLLIMTNDGDLTFKLTHPKHTIFKTYVATLNDVPHPKNIEKLRKGVVVDGKKTQQPKVNWLKDNIVEISISEGRNRQVRKMFEAIGYEVVTLQRVSIGNLALGNIPLGRWRHLSQAEINYLKSL
ncbi:MAG: rRNA pseudouridine synthase [Clostridia bacterium]|nr:rRNA pseudouridine synthase [Clostridia bacterium]